MNKVFNINLGGYPFTIDEDAYEHLSSYLKTIHRHFRDSDGYEEITGDIEARLAELFQESLDNRPIVTLKDVRNAIAIMGTPEDFGAEAAFDADEDEAPKTGAKTKYRTGKRLFRNPDDEVIGGVCSGIAAYFGIPDPLWVRLLFVLIAISGGVGIPAYLILWAILPKAESASDRLSMRGEPINVSNIGKIIEGEMEHLSTKVSELGDELSSKFGSKKKSYGKAGDVRGVLAQGIAFLGSLIRGLIELLQKIIRPIFVIVGIALLIALAVLWVASLIGLSYGSPFLDFLFPQTIMSVLSVTNILVIIGIPLVSLFMLVMRLLFHTRISRAWRTGLWVFWSVNVASFFFLGSILARDFTTGREMPQQTFGDFPETETLSLEMMENPYADNWYFLGEPLQFVDHQLVSYDIRLTIERSETGQFELVQSHYSRGRTTEDATRLAEAVQYRIDPQGAKVLLSPHFQLPAGNRWRAQHVDLILRVPEGKSVSLSREVSDKLYDIELDENQKHPWWYSECKTWTMSPDGMYCPEWIEKNNQEKQLSVKDFSKLHIKSTVPVKVRQAEPGQFSVRIKGKQDDLDKLLVVQVGSTLDLSQEGSLSSSASVEIDLPMLESLTVEEDVVLELSGFQQAQMELALAGNSEVKAHLEVDQLVLRQSDSAVLELVGEGGKLEVQLSDRARLEAFSYPVVDASITSQDFGSAELSVAGKLRKSLSSQSSLEVKGEPAEEVIFSDEN